MVNSMLIRRLQRYLLISGIVLLIASVVLMVTAMTGLVPLPDPLIAGESTVHSIARIAIIGCLLAAVGAME